MSLRSGDWSASVFSTLSVAELAHSGIPHNIFGCC